MATFALCADFPEADSQLWKVGQRRWTIQDEYNFSKWVETNITEDFFISRNIRVDCADVVYAVRWIYARINYLPASATTADHRLIGHWSTDWKQIPTDVNWEKDRRFRTALLYMIYNTSTRTMPSDTYPIYIAPDSVTAGTAFLIAGDHTGIVSRIVLDGSAKHPVQTFEANMPTRVQRLLLRNFAFPDPGHDHVSGFLKFRWPVKTENNWHYLPVNDHPFYSGEQYAPAFKKGYANYQEAVEKRIDPKVYDPNDKVEKIISTLNQRLNQRIPIVVEGNKKCQEIQCLKGSPSAEIYGTADKDEFIGIMLDHLETIIAKNHLDRTAIFDKISGIHLQISPDRFVTLQDVLQNFKWLSSDPRASIEARWGLDKCSIIAIHLKNAQESISFIQKRYGKADPHFAERAISTQQKIVDEMTREGRDYNCGISSRQYAGLKNMP